MTIRALFILGLSSMALTACNQAEIKDAAAEGSGPQVIAASDIAAGRYLVMTIGCNDCHTPGYAPSGGQVPETEWLKGNSMGFHGPWGTTYANNLRRTVAGMSEDEWAEMLSTRQDSAPMPWPSVRAMSDADKRALYRYIKSLPVEGDLAPTALPPGQIPTTPYEDMNLRQPGT